MGVLKDAAELLLHPLKWIASKPNRVRLLGGRVQVVALVLTRNPELLVLLGRSPYKNMWMPPQEGVNYNESIANALERCLEIECGVNVAGQEWERSAHVRSIAYEGKIDLSAERRGERPVADNVTGTLLEGIKLRRKAYWVATIIVSSEESIVWTPNGTELLELRWFPIIEAREAIRRTNIATKADFLLRCLEKSGRALCGADR